ncbi:MAG: hypothetical protein ACTIOH_05140 [Lactobacillus helveticus]
MENLVTEFAHTQDIADNKLVSYTLYKSHRIYIKQVYWSETMNWLVGYAEIQKENPIYSKLTNSQDLYMLPLEKEATSINDLEIDGRKLNSVFLGFDTAEPFERNISLSEFEETMKNIVDSISN